MLTSSKKINKHKIISFKVRFIRGVSVEAASFGNFGDGDAGPAANADEGSGDGGGKTADSRGRSGDASSSNAKVSAVDSDFATVTLSDGQLKTLPCRHLVKSRPWRFATGATPPIYVNQLC